LSSLDIPASLLSADVPQADERRNPHQYLPRFIKSLRHPRS